MSSRKIKRLGISDNICERLLKNNISTCKDVLSMTDLELLRILGTSKYTVHDLLNKASKACVPTPILVGEMWRNKREVSFLKTTLGKLDEVLHGGIPVASITELAGPSGCGKTQFCLMLSVLATLPTQQGGLDGAVVYIDTESAFSAERLIEIAQARFPDRFSSDKTLLELTQKVHVFTESTCSSLLKRLEQLEETLIEKRVKLIIVDSVASLVRKEYDSGLGKNLIHRTNLLAKQAALLKYIAEDFRIPVVVTNQITTRFGSGGGGADVSLADDGFEQKASGVSLEGDSGYVTAALGNTWSHSVNTRLILQYLDGPRRQILVAKSPLAPFSHFVYVIGAPGLQLDPGAAGVYEGTDPGRQNITVRSSLQQHAFSY